LAGRCDRRWLREQLARCHGLLDREDGLLTEQRWLALGLPCRPCRGNCREALFAIGL